MARPQVTVSQGTLKGKVYTTDSGFEYNGFSGIPYAKPPVGKIKFSASQPVDSWEGVRDASTEGNICASADFFYQNNFSGEEDCLFLNVYVPHNATVSSRLPVMFWIHGGAFTLGSGNKDLYGPDYLVEKNLIVVTINYRVGPLGFLCLHTPEIPGNAGIKDQILALKWVNENIGQFGGNKENITIFGESAGAISTHFLTMSPLTKGLYAKAIHQSGTSTMMDTRILFDADPVKEAFKLGELLGLKTDDKEELLQFLLTVPTEKLYLTFSSNNIKLFPVIERASSKDTALISTDIEELMTSGNYNTVPSISGYTSNEGVLFAMRIQDLDMSSMTSMTLEKLVPSFQKFIPKKIFEKLTPETSAIVEDEIKQFYFKNDENLLENFLDLASDNSFVAATDASVKLLAHFNPATYYYQFSYSGTFNSMTTLSKFPYKGACHGDDLGYVFKNSMRPAHIKPSALDIAVIKQITEMWSNFAITGNPTPKLTDNIKTIWKPVTKDEINCLDIDAKCTLIQQPHQERMQFWENLYKTHL